MRGLPTQKSKIFNFNNEVHYQHQTFYGLASNNLLTKSTVNCVSEVLDIANRSDCDIALHSKLYNDYNSLIKCLVSYLLCGFVVIVTRPYIY